MAIGSVGRPYSDADLDWRLANWPDGPETPTSRLLATALHWRDVAEANFQEGKTALDNVHASYQEEIECLRGLLAKVGVHPPECGVPRGGECTCGLSSAA